ncbi:hypothetical protein [Emticicia sp. BO119]|uniref:hypothetical protein n=1 Tax=Emticicia sp. BO119 TaxID=2757768 RepID=UPI0015F0B0B3|nr:hypothetical protein [Emticicia sp. BO119]MBA4853198.1 hypothetical protein [Emticicia sp. BO119]
MSGIKLIQKRHGSFIGTIMLLLLGAFPLLAQNKGSEKSAENVGIGTTRPDRSAILDLSSNTKGLLIPRMTLAQRGKIMNPANGLMVYQTDFLAGFYFFNGVEWKSLAMNSIGKSLREEASASDATWSINGNAGTNSDIHFIGTTDTSSLSFKVNNFRSGFIDYRFGNTYFGYRAGYRSVGFNSVAIGAYALHDVNMGLNNVAVGYQALPNNQTGSDNVAVGTSALFFNIIGSQNIALGTQAGQKSVGDGNVFIGNNAGINEIGNNKLYIENGGTNGPLIYGDFAKGYLGINTKAPETALSIDSKSANSSGLQLKQLTSASPAGRPNQKVLSVDEKGRIILVRDSIGIGTSIPTSPTTSYWTAKGNNIENNNTGDVIASNIRLKNLRSTLAAGKSNGKVLSVDENGLLILVKDSIGTTKNQTNVISGFWEENDNVLSNVNDGGSVILKGSVRLQNLTAYERAYTPYGKVLTVDDFGNLLLVRDSVGVGGGGPSSWNISGNNISNNNSGIVQINSGLRLPQLTSDIPVSVTGQKFLSVDNQGNVILANAPASTGGSGESSWALSGTNISNSNAGVVNINNGLNAKNGIKIETGKLTLSQLTANSTAGKSNGKVLSVDNSGNLILVRDSIATVANTGGVPIVPSTEPSPWAVNDNNISNKNTGNVYISNGLILSKLNSEAPTSVTSQKVLSVDANGQVILVNTPAQSGGGGGIGNSLWKNNDNGIGIVNNNTGGIFINSNEDNKSGLQLTRLKAGSPAGNAYGKVLSVDDSGNVILVTDGGSNVSNTWNTIDGRLHNANNGKVVIGTGINSYPDGFNLFVRGGILTERVRVALANSERWADYVFRPDYKLMPLKDVEKFIQHNQHLPNVPSAEEMANRGLDVAETSAKLMEKIEELTLYLIEANKRIEELDKKVKNLEKIQK